MECQVHIMVDISTVAHRKPQQITTDTTADFYPLANELCLWMEL